jgi:hypothetical protein
MTPASHTAALARRTGDRRGVIAAAGARLTATEI